MKIETKFNIGEKVWTVEIDESSKCVEVITSEISGINIYKDSEISYFFNEWCCDFTEENIVKYDDTETLINKIIELNNKIKGE